MLPPAISEQAASLIAGEERPALSFLVDLAADGEVERFEVAPSIVRSARRLSYVEADRGMGGGDPLLEHLAAIGRARQAARVRAGAVAIRSPEVDVHVDEEGRPVLHRIPAESPSRLAVTEAMVLAGAIAARLCLEAGIGAIYRRQAAPGEPPRPPEGGAWDPASVRRARRAMRRAEIGLEPGPHAGLGLDAYVQASSPLRRYQDLAVHRQLSSWLRGEPPCYDTEALRRIASTTERAEADARRAEEAADDYWLLRYLERFVGQALEATVVEVDPRPVVQLDETLREQYVKGLADPEPGGRVRVEVVRVEPRAGLLSLRPVD
jgi:exoribonuclease-2